MSGPAVHIVSVSGGKDSTALYLLALERLRSKGRDFIPVFADTDNEDAAVYEAIENLPRLTNGPAIVRVKADLSAQIVARREWIRERWPIELVQGRQGKWQRNLAGADGEQAPKKPDYEPSDPFKSHKVPGWKWLPAIAGVSEAEAQQMVAEAVEVLQPTGNAFLDLCLWKGLFPSSKRRFCTEYLKVLPINDQIIRPLVAQGRRVISWQGVRAQESFARSLLSRWQRIEQDGCSILAFRPLLDWKLEDVWAVHDRYRVPRNKLYDEGFGRVGCMPCIMAGKDEIRLIAARFPEHIDRIERWEGLVRKASRRGAASFMSASDDPLYGEGVSTDELIDRGGYSIRDRVAWARTTRGGLQSSFLLDPAIEFGTACNQWGACE